MPDADDIRWFKEQFHAPIATAVAGTPLDIDMLTAIACQETGNIWPVLQRKNMTVSQILTLCVGDTLDDTAGRRAFPRNQAELLAAPQGQRMFDIAHQALLDMAQHIPGFSGVAANPRKFCHGYGLFQRDLQFFKDDPDYFLERRYERFDDTIAQCIGELRRGLRKLGFENRSSLTDFEFASVAIAYNTGSFKPAKGLQQGHFNGSKFYGEQVFEFLRLAPTVTIEGAAPLIPPPGQAILPPPTPVASQGAMFVVETMEAPLRVRSEPRKSDPAGKNVVAHLPDGHPVRAVDGRVKNGFMAIETSLFGAHVQGFASAKHLVATPAAAAGIAPVVLPAAAPPTSGIVAVLMPRKAGTITKRVSNAGAHSLNEPDQPRRTGTTPAELVAELGAIIDYLAVDKPTHKRFQPRDGLTLCNICAHDSCHLAGVYLPRVWWTRRAIDDLAAGRPVAPLIGDTIVEVRANDLFRWLRDFGVEFGWRQTGTTAKLQEAANQGGLGLIVARRKEDGNSGHIVMIAPETQEDHARRGPTGEVVAPLQSQAGATNFRRGTGKANWWNGDQFAESAFWIHT